MKHVRDQMQDFAIFAWKFLILAGWLVVIPLAILKHETVGPWIVRLFT